MGSKRDDTETIGQFGIGFNVVYHLTDCPSFITGGKTMCIFDPHCRYAPGADKLNPGRRYDKLDSDFWSRFSDIRSAYLRENLRGCPFNFDEGSLFRFPLRHTKQLVMKSEVIDGKVMSEPMTGAKMFSSLEIWVPQVKEALLFLNNVVKFQFLVIEEGTNEVKLHAKYEMHLSDRAQSRRKDIVKKSQEFRSSKDPQPFLLSYSLTIATKKIIKHPFSSITSRVLRSQANLVEQSEQWFVQLGAGDLGNMSQVWKFIRQTLPKHGIAAKLNAPTWLSGKVFCFLPLPIRSNLPVHINGQFVLSSNRRALWDSDTEDDKCQWNSNLFDALSSSYAQFIVQAQEFLLGNQKSYKNLKEATSSVSKCYGIFPFWKSSSAATHHHSSKQSSQEVLQSNPEREWKVLAENTYKNLWKSNAVVLASVKFNTKANSYYLEWNEFQNKTDPFHQAYFMPARHKFSLQVQEILQKLGMTLTCAPLSIKTHLEDLKLYPKVANEKEVFAYYAKFHERILQCPSYPCMIEQTPFETVDGFMTFLQYVLLPITTESSFYISWYEFPSPPWNLPLLLSAKGCLDVFNKNNKLFCSKYPAVFSKTLSLFLHPKVVSLKLDKVYFGSEDDKKYSEINAVLSQNLSPALQCQVVDNSNDEFINMAMLELLWKCLEDDDVFSYYQTDIVKNWALLPSASRQLYSASSDILPMLPIDEEDPGQFQLSMFNLLRKFNIPVLDSSISCIAKRFCPDLSNHSRILKNLYHLHKSTNMLSNLQNPYQDVEILFTYFSRIDFRYDSISLSYIKQLPLFQTVIGGYSELHGKSVHILSIKFCLAGYMQWAEDEKVVFLSQSGQWRLLCSSFAMLNIQSLSSRDIYKKLVFPKFPELPADDRKKHLLCIRESLYEEAKFELQLNPKSHSDRVKAAAAFKSALKSLQCLSLSNGKLAVVSSFCDWTEPVFQTFPESFNFVEDEYRNDEWLDFFIWLGLRTSVEIGEYLQFCRQIQKGKHQHLADASCTLVNYLFSAKAAHLHIAQCLQQIAQIPFVIAENLPEFNWIKAVCQPAQPFPLLGIGLTKLSESALFKCAPLVWTVMPVVKLPEVSSVSCIDTIESCDDYNRRLLENLEVVCKPDTKDVYRNICNISRTAFSSFDLFSTYDPRLVRSENQRDIAEVLLMNIQFLYEENDEESLKELQKFSCIPVSAEHSDDTKAISKPVLVNSLQVVRTLSHEQQSFQPFINILPSYLHNSIRALQVIGINNGIELPNIEHMLELLSRTFKDRRLDINSGEHVRVAVLFMEQLFTQIKSCGGPAPFLDELYLPTKELKMSESTRLLFIDTYARFNKVHVSNLEFGKSAFDLFQIPESVEKGAESRSHRKSNSEKKLCLLLPRKVRPCSISLTCQEVLDENVVVESNETALSEHIRSLLVLDEKIAHVLHDVIYSETSTEENNPKPKAFVTKLQEILKTTSVVVCKHLKVDVRLPKDTSSTIYVSVGKCSVHFSLQKQDDDTYKLYIDTGAKPSLTLYKDLSLCFCIEVARSSKLPLYSYLSYRSYVEEIVSASSARELNFIKEKYNLEVDSDEENEEIDSEELKLGNPVPIRFRCDMDCDINHIFRPEEWVAYAIQENEFILAIVLHPIIGDADLEVRSYTRQYKIVIGETEPEGRIVSALDLYKFVVSKAPHSDSEGKELVVADPRGASAVVQHAVDSHKLQLLKKTIYKDLLKIWELPEDMKKKALRRLCLKYHPDKHTAECSLYEEAFKFLQRQLDRLEANLPLENPEFEENDLEEPPVSHWRNYYRRWGSAPGFYSRQPSSKGDGFMGGSTGGGTSGGTGGGTSSGTGGGISTNHSIIQPQPSPLEAKRWLRQASSDFEAMRVLDMNSFPCQVCFLAHEVVEKALKAGMYHFYGLNPCSLKTHELHSHASAIRALRPTQASNLDKNAVLIHKHYLNSRFPNVHALPQAPVDVYTASDSQEAAEIAKEVLDFVRLIIA